MKSREAKLSERILANKLKFFAILLVCAFLTVTVCVTSVSMWRKVGLITLILVEFMLAVNNLGLADKKKFWKNASVQWGYNMITMSYVLMCIFENKVSDMWACIGILLNDLVWVLFYFCVVRKKLKQYEVEEN